jgi:8-oxo-dGTP diphosphatase
MKLATLCYVKKDAHTLMVHRIKKANDMHQGKWNGLGGKLEPGESPEECALRELYEETGLRVANPLLKGFITFPAFDDFEDWYVYVFIIRQFTGELIDSVEGTLRWVPDAELLDLNLWEGDRIFLPWLDRPGLFSAKFIYNRGRLVSHTVVFHHPAAG